MTSHINVPGILICLILLFAISILAEVRNTVWRELYGKYRAERSAFFSHRASTISFHNKKRKGWFNHVYIDVGADGIFINFPFFKKYMTPVMLPWGDLEVCDTQSKKVSIFNRVYIHVKPLGIYISIPGSYETQIKKYII